MNQIFLVSCDGRIFILDELSSYFKPLCSKQQFNSNIKVKKLSSSSWSIWCILSNFEVNVFVFKLDTPIKHQAITYENQRRYNVFNKDAFTDNLLPTDRYHFSSQDGTEKLPKESFQLPSNCWSWDSDWFIEATTPDGWEYAIDFPANYHETATILSLVRRRKWLRNRTFNAYNQFIPIQSPSHNECIIDLAVGGWDTQYTEKGYLSVWAVSNTGKVFFRENVSYKNVEGTNWKMIELPPYANGVFSCSCSSSGEAWFIKWDGNILIRSGITRDNPIGSQWYEISKPQSDTGLRQIAIGSKAVWALDNQGSIYYRKGINCELSFGTKWISVPGTMNSISLSSKTNQLWGIDADHYLCFRDDIFDDSLTGKEWRRITLNIKPYDKEDELEVILSERFDENFRTLTLDQENYIETEMNVVAPIKNEIMLRNSLNENGVTDVSIYDLYNKSSLQTHQNDAAEYNLKLQTLREKSFILNTSKINSNINFQELENNYKRLDSFIEKLKQNDQRIQPYDVIVDSPSKPRSISNASDKSVSTNTSFNIDDTQSESSFSIKSSFQKDKDSAESVLSVTFEDYDNVLFKWCDALQCQLNTKTMPSNWLQTLNNAPSRNISKSILNQIESVWRNDLLNSLRKRNKIEMEKSEKFKWPFEIASSWAQIDEFKYLHKGKYIKNCKLEINPLPKDKNQKPCLYIKIIKNLNTVKEEIKLNLVDIACVTRYTLPERSRSSIFAIYKKSDILKPFFFMSPSEKKLNEWTMQISFYCSKLSNFTNLNETLVLSNSDGSVYLGCIKDSSINFIRQINGHFKYIEKHLNGHIIGVGYNGKLWFLSRTLNNILDDYKGPFIQTDEIELFSYENQRWNVLTGFSVLGFPTDRYAWSDETGKIRRNLNECDLPSSLFTWVSPWQVDYSTPGGTDKDGWQYSIDFPRPYHAVRNNLDFVRRRRWCRKCKIRVRGLWVEIPQTHIITSIALDQEIDRTNLSDQHILLWATEADGNVLCSIVDITLPTQCRWRYVNSEIPFKYITIGKSLNTYGISMSGHVYYRIGVNINTFFCGTSWGLLENTNCEIKMKQISAGNGTLWAISEDNEVFFRENITKTFPEGTTWNKICDYVKYVSVNRNNQVYAIETAGGNDRKSDVLLFREGITENNKMGTSWKPMISLKWEMISNRGI